MRVGLDIDDVLFPWSDLAHAACERAGITNGKQVTQWSMYLDYGCTSAEVWEVIHDKYRGGMLLEPPFEGVVDILRAMREDAGWTVHLATARGFEGPLAGLVRSHTTAWLEGYEIPHDSLTFTKDKTIVQSDAFLDDSIPNVTALRAAGVNAYLHDQGHNRSDTTLPRVANLSEFASIIL